MAARATTDGQARVVVGLVAVQVFFGLHYIAAKLVLTQIPPRAWALMRVAGAAVVLLALVRLGGRRLPSDPAILRRLALLAVFSVVINQICFIEGLSRTTPTHSSLMNTTIPVVTLLFAVLLGQERMRLAKLAAMALATIGVVLIVRPWRAAGFDGSVAGDALTLVNATSYSFFLALSKRTFERVDTLAATAVLLAFGTVGVAVVGLPSLLATDLAAVTSRTWALAAFVVVFPTVGAYVLNNWALSRVQSSQVAFFIYLQPLLAATLSWTLLGERFGANVIGGASLIFVGVWLSLRPRRALSQGPAAPVTPPRGIGPTRRFRTPGSDAGR